MISVKALVDGVVRDVPAHWHTEPMARNARGPNRPELVPDVVDGLSFRRAVGSAHRWVAERSTPDAPSMDRAALLPA